MNRERAVEVLRPLLPAKARLALRRMDRAVDPVMTWRYRRRSGETRPLPPRAIRERNAVDNVGYWYTAVDEATRPLLSLTERAGFDWSQAERVLDFGCGAGKVIAALRGSGPELHGCDIHAPSIAWLKGTYPELNVIATGFDPPLPYPDAHFDLVWAWSVLTHLDADRQRAWVAEWARILKPGGLLLATYNSPLQMKRTFPAEHLEHAQGVLEADGVFFAQYDTSGNFSADFAGTTEAYGDTYNETANVEALMAPHFESVELVPDAVWGNQDCAVARRPAA